MIFPTLSLFESIIDIAAISLIFILFFLSLLSISFIFFLRIKSRTDPHLLNFSSLWIVRFLLVSFVSLWALTQFLALPFLLRYYFSDYLPPLTISQQDRICKVHIVLSLGFLEPGFLVTLLFLISISIQKGNPEISRIIVITFSMCITITLLQVFFVFISPMMIPLPEIFHRSYVVLDDQETVLCTYPLTSTILFGLFGVIFLVGFVLTCLKVVSVVINKALRIRLYALGITVVISLIFQFAFLGLSSFWTLDKGFHGFTSLAVFLSAISCATVGEGILVIRPIADALAAGGESCGWLTTRPPVGGHCV